MLATPAQPQLVASGLAQHWHQHRHLHRHRHRHRHRPPQVQPVQQQQLLLLPCPRATSESTIGRWRQQMGGLQMNDTNVRRPRNASGNTATKHAPTTPCLTSHGLLSSTLAGTRLSGSFTTVAAMKASNSGENLPGSNRGSAVLTTVSHISMYVDACLYGYCPVAHSNATTPRLQMSDEKLYALCSMRSGDMYLNVPVKVAAMPMLWRETRR